MRRTTFINELSEDIFNNTKSWNPKDWENFRKAYYKDYFAERDSIIVSINNKDKYGHANLYNFNERKLNNIKSYNREK